MKIIPLIKFFDLYAGTYNQQELYNAIREVYDEDVSTSILNRMTPHLLRVTSPAGEVVHDDTVLTRLRSNKVDVDLVLDSTGLGDMGYHACWAGEHYYIAFKHRAPDAERYYVLEAAPTFKVNLNEVFDHEAGGYSLTARANLCRILSLAQASQEWPVTETAMINTAANISDRLDTLRRQHATHHATLVIERPTVENGIASWSVTLGEEKPADTVSMTQDGPHINFGHRRYFDPGYGQPILHPHPQDRWPGLTNQGIVELLKCYALTQVAQFPMGIPVAHLPQGLDLLQLIQLRLGNMSHRPGMHEQFHMQGQRYMGGAFCNTHQNLNGFGENGDFGQTFPYLNPRVSHGRYARQAFTGAWVWYPNTPLFVVLPVDRSTDSPQDTLTKLLHSVLENLGGYGAVGERHIPNMAKEIQATLENDPDAMNLLANDYVTLFVGERSQVHQSVRERTNNSFTNWVLSDGAWNPQKEYTPTNVINTIEGIAKHIAGYADDYFAGYPKF